MTDQVGISAIGLAIPSLALLAEDLAIMNNTKPEKYLEGLGVQRMAVCSPEEDASTLAVAAARNALEAWGQELDSIGLVVVGTESGNDYSKPLTQSVCRDLNLGGAVRSYEVKHACLGASLAVRQAIEWYLSGASKGQYALVIASDVCTYEQHSASEATQGAGAVALVIGEPVIAEIALDGYSYSCPVDDFMRPIGDDYPIVNAPLSHRSYLNAAVSVFSQWDQAQSGIDFDAIAAMTFHCPFPKMVKKTVSQVMANYGFDRGRAEELFNSIVKEHLSWNRKIGNAYTASLWFSVAHALADSKVNGLISAFSYGSGSGAELMFLQPREGVHPYWATSISSALESADIISQSEYKQLRSHNG